MMARAAASDTSVACETSEGRHWTARGYLKPIDGASQCRYVGIAHMDSEPECQFQIVGKARVRRGSRAITSSLSGDNLNDSQLNQLQHTPPPVQDNTNVDARLPTPLRVAIIKGHVDDRRRPSTTGQRSRTASVEPRPNQQEKTGRRRILTKPRRGNRKSNGTEKGNKRASSSEEESEHEINRTTSSSSARKLSESSEEEVSIQKQEETRKSRVDQKKTTPSKQRKPTPRESTAQKQQRQSSSSKRRTRISSPGQEQRDKVQNFQTPPAAKREEKRSGTSQKRGSSATKRQVAPSGGESRPRSSLSQKAHLVFPVRDCERRLREQGPGLRVAQKASVYLTSVIEYLCAEVLELGAEATRQNRRTRIRTKHIREAINHDQELDALLGAVILPQMPH